MSSASTAESIALIDIHVIEQMASKPSFGDIPLNRIRASKTNPRKIFDADHLKDLAASIKKHGVAQPILLRPVGTDADGNIEYEIVAGERRFRASGLAEMPTVPAIVRQLNDIEALEIQVIENLQRQDLHPLEEAEGYEVLMKEAKFTAEQMADKVGKSKAYIYASLKLCALAANPRQAFYDGRLTKSTALLVARIPVAHLQEQCVSTITSTQFRMSTRDAAEYIERTFMLNLKKAAFKPSDATLCPSAGSCTTCPNRSGNQPEVFADVNADVCTDPVCYKSKTDAHVIRIKQLATANGQTVFSGAEAKKIMPSDYSGLRTGYVRMDDINWDDEKKRTFRQILGKEAPKTALIESPHSDKVVEIIKVSDIAPILEEKGVKLDTTERQTSNDSTSREKEQEAKAKLERQYRTELFTQIHHASLMMNLVDQDLRLVARIMFDNLPSNTIPTKLVMSLHGWDDTTFSYPDRATKVQAAFDALTPAQLNQLIRDCALSHDLHVNVYTSYSEKDEPNRLLDMARRTKVDAKAIRKTIDDAAKAKADAKKKVADKKTRAAAPAVQPAKTQTPAPAEKAKAKVKAKVNTTTGKAKPAVKKSKPAAPAKATAAPATKTKPTVKKPAADQPDLPTIDSATPTPKWPYPHTSKQTPTATSDA